MSFLLRTPTTRASRMLPRFASQTRRFTTSRLLAVKVDSNFLSEITAAEKKITHSDEPMKGGPTAAAQSHVGQELTPEVISAITAGEKLITNKDGPVPGGPTAVAQSFITSSGQARSGTVGNTVTMDSDLISKVTDAEKSITGEDGPVTGGPTARAQQHANEQVTGRVIHDVTEGEKVVTGGERIKGGPTSTVQSEVSKGRSS